MIKMTDHENMNNAALKIGEILNTRYNGKYYFILSLALLFTLIGSYAAYKVIDEGIVLFGLNISVTWGLSIASFVFWIGIGHAGTLISAILFLLNQEWRNTIHRIAEAMTIIAVILAALFLLIHTGRPWFAAYWLFPYPSQMGMWVNFISPLIWDLFAVLSYFMLSLLFWYFGMIPDMAYYKDKVRSKFKSWFFDLLSLGFYGNERQWYYYKRTYLIMAGIATAMVISVHTIVSFDFAVTIVPGWHSTIFPVYFVVGAIFSGLAMVLKLLIIIRYSFGLKEYINAIQFNNLNKIFLGMSIFIGYSYMMEFLMAFMGGNVHEQHVYIDRILGHYSLIFWFTVFVNVLLPQLFWFRKYRLNIAITFVVSLLVNIGMWFERFVIVVQSLYKDTLLSASGMYFPSWIEISLLMGSLGLFTLLFMIFIRLFPIMSLHEIKPGK